MCSPINIIILLISYMGPLTSNSNWRYRTQLYPQLSSKRWKRPNNLLIIVKFDTLYGMLTHTKSQMNLAWGN